MKKSFLFLLVLVFFPVLGLCGEGSGEFLAVSDEMTQFMDKHLTGVTNRKDRLQKLIDSIYDRTLLDFEYSESITSTARETFKNRRGNCLSYTGMFIAMVRYAGLPARFQEVYDYSTWTKRENLVVFNRHINAVVFVDGKKMEVDFSTNSDKDKFLRRSRLVSDDRAHAHFYNNLGAEALMAKDYTDAESLFNRAIAWDKTFSPTWNNLGLLFRQTGRLGLAEKSYLKAMSLDKNDVSARANLFRLFKTRGEIDKAVKIRQSIERVYDRNPFYHFNLGQEAYKNRRFRLAIKHFRRAIKRKSGERLFYSRMAAAYDKLGNDKAAKKYLKKSAE
ncbi:MAG: tetratricopeptide repeat protein [bacterium]|nr:tetratricopeptide repeat protein [bacterium]